MRVLRTVFTICYGYVLERAAREVGKVQAEKMERIVE